MFDCDGVLFDSREANVLFYNDLLRRLGRVPMSPEEVDFVHVHTVGQAVAHLLRGNAAALAEAERIRPSLDYDPYIEHMRPEATLQETLSALAGRCRLAVCTNRTTTIGAVLARHGVASYFDLVVSALDVARPKPAPDQLLKALAAFDCPAGDALYVGDSEVDEEAALLAAVPFAAYRNPRLAAAFHLERLAELPSLLS